jgi:hypothetical protein
MNEFIEKNRGLLRFYCIAAQCFGWGVLVVVGAAVLGHSLALATRIGDSEALAVYLPNVPWNMISFIPIGIVALGVGQFIRYLIDSECQLSWLLRHGDKLLCLYAVFVIGYYVLGFLRAFSFHTSLFETLVRLLVFVLFPGAKVLVLIGLGQLLRRVLPVIEESKTLV